MPLITLGGKLLRTPGGLASSLNCCCGDDPCNCGQNLTYYIRIEISGLPEEHIHYANRPPSQPSCPACYVLGISYLAELNGTYFVPLKRQCTGGVASFIFDPAPTTHTLATGTTDSWSRLSCSGSLVQLFGVPRVTLTVTGTGTAQISILRTTINSSLIALQFDNSANVISFPEDLCKEDIDEMGNESDAWINNIPEAGCTSFTTGGPVYRDNVGYMSWSIVQGEPP